MCDDLLTQCYVFAFECHWQMHIFVNFHGSNYFYKKFHRKQEKKSENDFFFMKMLKNLKHVLRLRSPALRVLETSNLVSEKKMVKVRAEISGQKRHILADGDPNAKKHRFLNIFVQMIWETGLLTSLTKQTH